MAMRSLVFSFLVLNGILVIGNLPCISADCSDSFSSIMGQCEQFFKIEGPKIPPSTPCCDVLKNVDVPCLCKYITPSVERTISVEKAVYVAETCGVAVPRGTMCGSYKIPPAAAPNV